MARRKDEHGGEPIAANQTEASRGATSLTVENYVKTIYRISSAGDNAPASTGEIAESLSVAPGTVTSMLKTLGDRDLATYTPYEGVSLTPEGKALALRVLRRHRLIELFLTETLKMTWDEVHEEAEHMEHAASDRLVDRIDEWLGFPAVDPHGDPIPDKGGAMRDHAGECLADANVGQQFRIVRVLDQAPEFLRYLSEAGLELGATGTVAQRRAQADVVTVEVGGLKMALSQHAARKIIVLAPKDV